MAQSRQEDQQSQLAKSSANKRCCCLSFNSLPSVWYGIATTIFHAYIVLQGGKMFLEYMDSKYGKGISTWEMNLYISLQSTSLLILPFLAFASIFKLGNLANDGYRLGRRIDLEMDLDLPRSRTRDPLVRSGSACGAAWRHCPPVGPSLHAIAALCSLVAKLVLEARMIKDQLLTRDNVWKSDLDLAFLHSLWPEKGSFISSDRLIDQTPFPSPEFISYILALLAFAVRCSDVFWGANKCLAFLISLQLIANGIHALLAFCGASVLYKIELIGAPAVFSGASGALSDYLLLDPPITVMLLMLLSLTLLLGCSPLSMYALNKLSAFLTKSRRKYMRELPSARSYLWSFYPHLAALATLLAVAASAAPLLHDFSKMYKLNPQPVLLAAVTGSIVHAFLWVALWLLLTAKTNWDFRLKISVGRTLLKSPSCLALAAEIEFKPHSKKQSEESEALLNGSSTTPILILSGGKAYGVMDCEVQQKIQHLVAQSTENKGGDNHNQVYWLRGGVGGVSVPSPSEMEFPPSPTLPEPISNESNSICCSISDSSRKVRTPQHSEATIHSSQSAVIRNPSPDVTMQQSQQSLNTNAVLSPILTRPIRKPLMRIPNSEEDGDYATLRDLPLVTLPEEPVDLHESSSSSDSSGVDSGFGSGSKRQIILPTQVHSPRPSRDLCNPYGYVKPKMTTFSSQPGQSHTIAPHQLTPVQHSPFNSLPLGHLQRSIHNQSGTTSFQSNQMTTEERRPAIQACLFAGQGFESNVRPN